MRRMARGVSSAISNPADRLGLALLAVAFVALTSWSWKKWPDVLVDFGRELYVPWQLASGQTLYADIAYFNGPLSPWLNSVLFRVFGVSLTTLVVANLLLLLLVAAMVYALVRQVGRPLAAAVATLFFLTVFSVGQYVPQGNYNFVTPYSHEMTHGTFLSLAALVLLVVHVRRGGVGSAFACGVALGLTFLTKAEFFLAAGIAVLCGLALHHGFSRTPIRSAGRLAAAVAAGLALPPALAFFALLRHLPAGDALRGVSGSWAHLFIEELRASELYQNILGVVDTGESLRIIGEWSFYYALVLIPAVLIGWWLPRSRQPFVAAPLFLLGAAGVLVNWKTASQDTLGQPMPVVILAILVVLFVMLQRPDDSGENRTRRVLMLTFAVFGLAMLAKMLLYVRFSHYGFALAMPSAIVLTVALVEGVPAVLDSRGKNGPAFRMVVLGVLAAVMGVHLYASNSWFRLRTVEVGQGSDAFLTDARGRVANDLLTTLGQVVTPGQTLVVLPEGVIFNYLSRTPNPTPFINFMPPELIIFGEDTIVAGFEANPPDWIVLTDRHAPEYGLDLLGTDYGLKIIGWVRRNYRLEAEVVDPAAQRNQLRYAYILRRTESADP